jgi:acetyltransferase-like isoleucine patch superfamily enzyme
MLIFSYLNNLLSGIRIKILSNIANTLTPHFYLDDHIIYDHRFWEPKCKLLRLTGLKIGKNVAIDSGFETLNPSQVFIDDWCSIGRNTKITNFNIVEIGKFNMFAAEVQISNGSHEVESFIPSSSKLVIGNGCWIGHGVKIIGKDITIGDNAIIGAGSLVISSIEPNSIMAGVPAKKIGTRIPTNLVWHLGNTYFDPKNFQLKLNQSI